MSRLRNTNDISTLIKLSQDFEFRIGPCAPEHLQRAVDCISDNFEQEFQTLDNDTPTATTLWIRFLRNMCVQNPRNQVHCREFGALKVACKVVMAAVHISEGENVTPFVESCEEAVDSQTQNQLMADEHRKKKIMQLMKAAVQFFANCVSDNHENQAYVWKNCVVCCVEYFHHNADIKLREFFSLLLLKCLLKTVDCEEFLKRRENARSNGSILNFLLAEIEATGPSVEETTSSSDDESNDSGYSSDDACDSCAPPPPPLILHKITDPNPGWARSALTLLLEQDPTHNGGKNSPASRKSLLALMCQTVDKYGQNDSAMRNRSSSFRTTQILELFCDIMQEQPKVATCDDLNVVLDFLKDRPAGVQNVTKIICLRIVAQKLASTTELPSATELRDYLATLDIIKVLLSILRQYPPPPPNARTPPQQTNDGTTIATVAALKTGALQVVANLVFGHKKCQDLVREAGGLVDVLNHSMLHPAFPLLREWALFTVRNLTEGNEENQKWMRDMKPKKAIPSQDLEARGLKLVLNQVCEDCIKLLKEINYNNYNAKLPCNQCEPSIVGLNCEIELATGQLETVKQNAPIQSSQMQAAGDIDPNADENTILKVSRHD